MRYQKLVDLDTFPRDLVKHLQPGQHVCNGSRDKVHCGRFWGLTRGGTIVVAWNGNASGRYHSYNAALRNYAKSWS